MPCRCGLSSKYNVVDVFYRRGDCPVGPYGGHVRDNAYRYHLYSPSKSYGARPGFVAANDLPQAGFISVYGVDEATAKAIVSEGTTKGFKGVVWSERLWIDVDSYEAADAAESKLTALGLDFVAYDSGKKGAHFGVLRDTSSTQPSHLLPLRDKQWVKSVLPDVADLSIYTHLHPFRLPGTVHEDTGRAKVLVTSHAGRALALPPLSAERIYVSPSSGVSARSVFDCYRVMSNTVPVSEGERHPTLVRLLYALKDDAGFDMSSAIWWLGEWNKMLSEPKEDGEIEKAVRSIYER